MTMPETWQRPAADDINPDALEYLFAPERRKKVDPPWVKMVTEPEPVARISPEYIRLQTKVEVIAGHLDRASSQLQDAHTEIGFLKAQLADRDAKLEQLAEYRAKAAQVILSDCENERLRKRINILEEIIAEFEAGAWAPNADWAMVAPVPAIKPDSQNCFSFQRNVSTTSERKGVKGVPLMPLTYLLMIGFAWAVLITLMN